MPPMKTSAAASSTSFARQKKPAPRPKRNGAPELRRHKVCIGGTAPTEPTQRQHSPPAATKTFQSPGARHSPCHSRRLPLVFREAHAGRAIDIGLRLLHPTGHERSAGRSPRPSAHARHDLAPRSAPAGLAAGSAEWSWRGTRALGAGIIRRLAEGAAALAVGAAGCGGGAIACCAASCFAAGCCAARNFWRPALSLKRGYGSADLAPILPLVTLELILRPVHQVLSRDALVQ